MIEHLDILGQSISVDSYVAAPYHNTLYVCIIKKIHPKMIRVCNIKDKTGSNGWLVYPTDTIALNGPDAMVYILKHV